MYQASSDPDLKALDDDHLFVTAAELNASDGLSSVTIREVAKRAAISPSGLLYKYKNRETFLENLFRWAIRQDEQNWAQKTQTFSNLTVTEADLAPLSKAVVINNAQQNRVLITLLWDLQLHAERHVALKPLVREWRQLDIKFWTGLFAATGRPLPLATGWASAMLIFQRLLILSPNTETGLCWANDAIQRLYDRLSDRPATRPGDSIWRKASEHILDPADTPEENLAPTAQRILSSASELIMSNGSAALSHRAIARDSGVSLSSLTHHFASLDDILIGAFSRIYENARQRAESVHKNRPSYSRQEFIQKIVPNLSGPQKQEQTASIAMDDIILTASRRKESQPLAIALFAMTGSTLFKLLSAISDSERQFDRLDGQVLRLTISGLMCGHDGNELDELIETLLNSYVI